MVWLDISDEFGNAIYFDIHHVVRQRSGRRWRHSVNGVCGNGLFEIEVLVEPAEQGEVTYLDLSAGAFAGKQLLSGIDSLNLESGLIDAARKHCGLLLTSTSSPQPYPHPFASDGPQTNETGPVWQEVV